MRFKVMSKSIKTLVLASVLSIVAASAALAGGAHGLGGDFHASAAPNCDGTGSVQKKGEDRLFGDSCRVIATEGPGGIGGGNGRSAEINTWHPMLAGGGVRTDDPNGRSAALSQGGGEF